MTINPLRDLIGPLMSELDSAAVKTGEKMLDELTDALAKDLANPRAPKERATQIIDIATDLFAGTGPERLAMMLSVAVFRVVEARRDEQDTAE